MRRVLFAATIVWACASAQGRVRTWTVAPQGPADFNNLSAAVAAAADGDVVELAEGLYVGGANREVSLRDRSVTVRGRRGNACIIDLQGQGPAFRVEAGGDLALEAVTIRSGQALVGGAVLVQGGVLWARRCIFVDNLALSEGGALGWRGGTGGAEDCLFLANRSLDAGGAVAQSWGGQELSLIDCRFYGNQARRGGAVSAQAYDQTLSLTGCVLVENEALDRGGALYVDNAVAALTNCEVAENEAANQGGGLYTSWTEADLIHCTIRGNEAGEAGGLYSRYGDRLNLWRCAVTGNRGGGVFWYHWDETACSLETCLFWENTDWDWFEGSEDRAYQGVGSLNLRPYARDNRTGDPAYALDHHARIRASSACIDPAQPRDPGTGLGDDIDGVARITSTARGQDLSADIGAYEYGAEPLLAASPRVMLLDQVVGEADPNGVLTLRNTGAGEAVLTVTTDAPWLHVDPNGARLSADGTLHLDLRVDGQGLDRGLFTATVTIASPQAGNAPRTVPVLLRRRGTLHVPTEYPDVAAAVGTALAGETVIVEGGDYPASLQLYRPLTLEGRDGARIGGVVLQADGAVIRGLTCSGRSPVIWVSGRNNVIEDNILIGGGRGLVLSQGGGNRVAGNTLRDCREIGLRIENSSGNVLRDNHLLDNRYGFDVQGDFDQDVDMTNTVDGQPIVYLRDTSDAVVFPAQKPACVYLVRCQDVVVLGVVLSGQGKGLSLIDCTDVTVRNVTVTDQSDTGILLQGGRDNHVVGSTVRNCGRALILNEGTDHGLSGNTLSDNQSGFACTGSERAHFMHTIDTTNTQDGRPIVYLIDAQGVTVTDADRAACVYAIGCRNLRVQDLELQGNVYGVLLYDCEQVELSRLVLTGNKTGLATLGRTQGLLAQDLVVQDNDMGLRLGEGQDVEVSGATIADNLTGLELAGVEAGLVDRCRIQGNRGGLRNSNSALTVQNCIVLGNGPEGGIDLNSSRENLIQFCTIARNTLRYGSSQEGGGITGWYDNLSVENCVVCDNTPGQIPTYEWFDQRVTNCVVTGGFTGSGNLDIDPLLTPEGHLRRASPCRGAGFSSHVPSLDFDGEARLGRGGGRNGQPRSGKGDIGADHYTDGDDDGLPDWVERYVDPEARSMDPNADTDGDGRRNLDEYEIYGTHPAVPAAVYHVDPVSGDDARDGRSWEQALRSLGEALGRAQGEDRVVLAPGRYDAAVTFQRSSVTVEGSAPADPNAVAGTILTGAVHFTGSQARACVLEGVTLIPEALPAVLCEGGAQALLRNCVLREAHPAAADGGSTEEALIVCTGGADLTLDRCRIVENELPLLSALLMESATMTLRHCLVAGNTGGLYAQALIAVGGRLSLENCTVADNRARGEIPPEIAAQVGELGGITQPAILGVEGAVLHVRNSILWNEAGRPEIDAWLLEGPGPIEADLAYSTLRQLPDSNHVLGPSLDLQTADPRFVRPGQWDATTGAWQLGDYHLQSQGARWDPALGWVADSVTSPGIDAGDPAASLDAEPTPADLGRTDLRNTAVNQGVYGGTAEASLAPQ